MGEKVQRPVIRGNLRTRPQLCQVDSGPSRFPQRGHGEFCKLLHDQKEVGGRGPPATPELREWRPIPKSSVRFSRHVKSDFHIEDHEEVMWMKEVYKMIRKGNNRCRPLDVLEIYAYPNSQLTSVAQSSGLHAERFTFEDGDLSTVAGRVKLLTTVLLKQPRHVWLAPDCGPWSPWSRFNALRSVQGFHRVDQAQLASLVHLKLCNLICKIQLSAGRHAHIENPWTSGIWRRRELEDFLTASLPARLDQCMFHLRHPETKDPMEKKTRVQTSSREMWLELDNRICDKFHEHAPIAGQCHFKGHEIAVSKFAGHYPRTFAKAIVRGIIRSKEGPIEKPIFHVEHLEIEEPPAKRARLEESLPDDSMPDVEPRIDAEPWKPVMDKLKSSLPKSGVQTITNPGLDVFQSNKLCPISALEPFELERD